jgi:RNA polymerase sigma-70 factor (ECF subfamily)
VVRGAGGGAGRAGLRADHPRWRLLPTWANGQLAFGCFRWHDDCRVFVGEGLDVLTLRAGRIVAITAFLVADLGAYGLPSTICS